MKLLVKTCVGCSRQKSHRKSKENQQCRLYGHREEKGDIAVVPTIKLNTKRKAITHEEGKENCTEVRFILPGSEFEDAAHEK